MNSTFTFQSGDIQMQDTMEKSVLVLSFTFQSGDIQIIEKSSAKALKKNLHSNLVIFKCNKC